MKASKELRNELSSLAVWIYGMSDTGWSSVEDILAEWERRRAVIDRMVKKDTMTARRTPWCPPKPKKAAGRPKVDDEVVFQVWKLSRAVSPGGFRKKPSQIAMELGIGRSTVYRILNGEPVDTRTEAEMAADAMKAAAWDEKMELRARFDPVVRERRERLEQMLRELEVEEAAHSQVERVSE